MSTQHTPWVALDAEGKHLTPKHDWTIDCEGAASIEYAPVLDAKGGVVAFAVSRSSSNFATHASVTPRCLLIAAAPDLLADLREAVATLRRYEALHRAKGTEDSTAKAEANAGLASRFEATIAKATRRTS